MGQAKKKQRDCPAIGQKISSAECGNSRHSNYNCPEQCPFNPFSIKNYEDQLRIEDIVESKIFKTAVQETAFTKQIERLSKDDQQGRLMPGEFESRMIVLFQATEFRGHPSLIDYLLSEEADSLRNDEKIYLEGRNNIRFALIEIRSVYEEYAEAVDLLDAHQKVFRIVDQNLLGVANRFQVCLMYTYPTPHFNRVFGSAPTLNDPSSNLSHAEEFEAILNHLGCEDHEAEKKRKWCLQHAPQIEAAFTSLNKMRLKKRFEATDAGTFERIYTLNTKPGSYMSKLEKRKEIEISSIDDTDGRAANVIAHYAWYAPESADYTAAALEDAETCVHWGNVSITADSQLKIECFSKKTFEWLSDTIEKIMGTSIQFESELQQDLAKIQAEKITIEHPEWVPMSLLEEESGFSFNTYRHDCPNGSASDLQKNLLSDYYQKVLDEPLPALEGITPREAARSQDPKQRSQLISWVKGIIRSTDQHFLQSGILTELDWIFDELQLPELQCKANPRIKPEVSPPDFSDFDNGAEEETEAEKHWNKAFANAINLAKQQDPQEITRQTLAAGLKTLHKPLFKTLETAPSSIEAEVLETLNTILWNTIHPVEKPLFFDEEEMEDELDAIYDAINEEFANTPDLIQFLKDHCEIPELIELAMGFFSALIEDLDEKTRTNLTTMGIISTLFVINMVHWESS